MCANNIVNSDVLNCMSTFVEYCQNEGNRQYTRLRVLGGECMRLAMMYVRIYTFGDEYVCLVIMCVGSCVFGDEYACLAMMDVGICVFGTIQHF